MRPEGGCRPEIRPPGKRCGAAAPKLSSQLHKQGCDPRMGPRCCTRSPTGRQKHSSAAACSHVGRSAGPRTTAPSERCCAPGDGHYNNVAIKEQNKKRQWFAAQGPDVALSLATNWRNGPFFPPLEQLAPIRGHTMRALVSPRTPRSHHPGCPLLLPATRPDLQAEHPAAPSAELGGGDGGSRAGLCPPGGHKRCRSSSTVPLQFCCSRAGMRCRRFGAKLSKLCGPAKQMRALQAKTPRCDTNKRVLIVQKGRRCFSASLQPPTALLR